jgi:hypothetical protein
MIGSVIFLVITIGVLAVIIYHCATRHPVATAIAAAAIILHAKRKEHE